MNIKKIMTGLMIVAIITIIVFIQIPSIYANAPTFEKNYVKYLTNSEDNPNGNETLRNLKKIGVDKNISIMDNIKNIFYPDSIGGGGKIRDIIKMIGLIVFVTMLVVQGFHYVLQADEEDKVAKYHINFAYIFLGGLIFFGATRILGIGLNIGGDGGSTDLVNNIDTSILFQIFSGLRAGAFFVAIILLGFNGRKMMVAMDDGDKVKSLRQGIINIVVSLVVIKVIDYVYFIAQTPDLKSKATEALVEISKVLGYVLGSFFTLSLIYYGFRLMFSNGNDENLQKVKDVIMAVFLGSLVIFIFFLIIYQITQEFAG